MQLRLLTLALLALSLPIINGCHEAPAKKVIKSEHEKDLRMDAHSYSKPLEAKTKHLNWQANINFKSRTIDATASWDVEMGETDSIIFDSYQLDIKSVKNGNDEDLKFELGNFNEDLGTPLTVFCPPTTKNIKITYKTSPTAEALQWLNPQQTAGKVHPFLFSQSQAILARTWLPCQDSPGVRFTYDAEVTVPKELIALMSASNPVTKNEEGVYNFKMEQPIPAYLMAISVGDVEFASVGDRTGIYAEPVTIKAAAYEFADMEKMLLAAEDLYGAYAWDRYDLIVLPPSFPFGGMENPRLTFATPTIIAGDRSLTALVAHELAHSWSGNLVTNATWDDFWLNEGFTVYFERRIMESIYGEAYADMLGVLGFQDLEEDLAALEPRDTKLKLELTGRNPDDGMTNIAYEKGYFLLRTIEERVGREAFDTFLRKYFSENAFKTMITEDFLVYLDSNLFAQDTTAFDELKINHWVYEAGLPSNCPKVISTRFQEVSSSLKAWADGAFALNEIETKDWSSHEWLYFLRSLPDTLTKEQLIELDNAYGFTQSQNSEVLAAWFIHTIRLEYQPADEALEGFLVSVGRRKFLVPIYSALANTEKGKQKALEIYKKARPNYHAVSTQTIDKMLSYQM